MSQIKREIDMTNQNHKANMKNANKGTRGQNTTHAQNQGNRGKQLNPNAKPSRPSSQTAKSNKH